MLSDFRLAFRQLSRERGFTLIVALTLALGVGVNTAMFTLAEAMLWKPLPYPAPERLVTLWERNPKGTRDNAANPNNYFAWHDRNRSFEAMAATVPVPVNLGGADAEPEQVRRILVTREYFDVLGVKPMLGRTFTEEEMAPGAPQSAILSYELWQRRYAGDPSIIGKKIVANLAPATVIGIVPRGFRAPMYRSEVWMPLDLDRSRMNRGRFLATIARLKPGVATNTASEDMAEIARQLEKERPDYDAGWGATVIPLQEYTSGSLRTPLLLLLGAVGLVLLIACANVANLMLVRSGNREREMAIRAAIGANGIRLARQVVIESLVPTTLGGMLGVAAAYVSIPLLTSLLRYNSLLPHAVTLSVDPRVVAFAMATTLLAGLLCSLAPLLRLRSTNVQPLVQEGARSIGSARRSLLASTLMVAEVALSVVLLVAAGLLFRSLVALENVSPGFRAENVLSFDFMLGSNRQSDEAVEVRLARILEAAKSAPGVKAVGMSHTLPMNGLGSATCFWKEGTPAPPITQQPTTEVTIVSPGYFAAMGIPIQRGRGFTDLDRKEAKPVLLINQAMARQYFPGEDPIGKSMRVCWGKDEPAEIIGVTGDVHTRALHAAARPMVYFSYRQQIAGAGYLIVRTDIEPLAASGTVRRFVRQTDPDVPLSNVRTLQETIRESVARPRFQSQLAGLFSTLALALAAVGLYGVMAYSVSLRQREIGVRMALGARPGRVAGAVLRQALGMVAVGIAFGTAGAYAVSKTLESLLFSIAPSDPATYLGVPLVMLAVAAAASWIPAWRAARVDPASVLRNS